MVIRLPPWSLIPLIPLGFGLGCATTLSPQTADAPPQTLDERQARGLRPVEEPAPVEAEAVLLTGATVMTAAGDVFSPGHVLMEGGRIVSVGPPLETAPAGVHVIDAAGTWITPGIIDVHSHLGVYASPDADAHSDGNEATDPVTAGVWAEHSVWPQDPGLERAVAGGITALQILPGSANLVGGRGVTLRPLPARGSRAMRFPGAPETVKMACGENPKRVYGEGRGRSPSTRMGNLRDLREAFYAAQRYEAEWDGWERAVAEGGEGAKKPPPARDLDMETLVGVLRGDILVQVHCYRADDMVSMLQVADELGFHIAAFHHALEAYKIRDLLAEAGTATATWADWWGFKMEAWDGIPYNAALLTEAGASAIIHSDSSVDIQRLNQEAGKALAFGRSAGIELSDDDALKWVTLHPAEVLGLGGETGSLEAGKRGDVVVWSAHPFSVYAKAQLVFIDGALRYDASRAQTPWSDFQVGLEGAR